jgi:hypothetical protein
MSDIVLRWCMCRHVWHYFTYNMHCTIMSDTSDFTSCIVSRPYIMSASSWLTVLCLHRAMYCHIWYFCIYTVYWSVISDIIAFIQCIVPLYLILLYLRHLLLTTNITVLTSFNVVVCGCCVVVCGQWCLWWWWWCESSDSDVSSDSDE